MLTSIKLSAACLFLFSTTALSASCPTSYNTPPSAVNATVLNQEPKLNSPIIIQALREKLYTTEQLEQFLKGLHWWDGKNISAGTSVGEDSPLMWGCYTSDPQDISGIGCSLIYRERIEVLQKIYECHQRSGWPSATDYRQKK